MAAEKSPAFQFYPKDFLTDGHVAAMTLEERGAYITLLCLCWTETTLPLDERRLARILGCSVSTLKRMWPALRGCFVATDNGLKHKRLEKEREKQAAYRQSQKDRAAKRWQSHGSATALPEPASAGQSRSDALRSPISDLQSPKRAEEAANARSKRPIFSGQRLTVFEWQLDDCARTLGEHCEGFDLHEWFYALDGQAVASGLVIPKRDGGVWLQAQLVAEAQRRGLPLQMASSAPQAGKLTTRLASAIANIQREEEAAHDPQRIR